MKRILLAFLALALLPALCLAQADKALPTEPANEPEVELPSENQLMEQSINLPRVLDLTFNPAPNYPPCTDPNDAKQLIDGQIGVAGYDAEGSVAWNCFATLPDKRVAIDIKLKKISFITMMRFHLTGGRWAGASLPSNIFISVSVDGKSWPLRLRYFPSPTTFASENGHPFAGWLLLTKIFQLGRYVRIEFEMEDRGDLLLLDELQILGTERIYVYFRKNMDYWTEMQPGEKIVSFGTQKLIQEGNLIINPAFADPDEDGAPNGVRVESRELSPKAAVTLRVEQVEGLPTLVLSRGNDAGTAQLVLAAVPADAPDRKLVFSADIMTSAGSSCRVSVQGPVGDNLATSDPMESGQWKAVRLAVAPTQGAFGVTFSLEGKKGDVLRVRNVRLAVAD